MENRAQLNNILKDAVHVLTDPAGFYRDMPKTGGFADPLIFVVVMAVLMGLAAALFSLFGASMVGSIAAGFGALFFVPIMAVLGSFIGAAILFVIWKLMGSAESYETAYRCIAYSAAVYPVTAVLGLIPYLGTIVGVALGIYLMINASIQVHKLERQTTYIVFGVIGAIMLATNLGSEIAGRRMVSEVEQLEEQFGGIQGLEDLENMTPEEAGKAMGEFFRGLSEAAGEIDNGETKAAEGQARPAPSSADSPTEGEAMTPEQAGKALGSFLKGIAESTQEVQQPTDDEDAGAASASSADASESQ